MFYEGNRELFRLLSEKKKLKRAKNPHHKEIIAGLWMGGGAMGGVQGGSRAVSLHKHGYHKVFDAVGGSSTGFQAVTFLIAGQAWVGRSIYLEECTTPRFVSRVPLLRVPYRVHTRDYLGPIYRGEEPGSVHKTLDVGAVRASDAELYGATTCARTGQPLLLKAKEEPDIVQVMLASMAIPGLTRGPVEVNGRMCFDGGGTSSLRLFVETVKPDVLLISMNRPRGKWDGMSKRLLWRFLTRGNPREVREAFIHGDKSLAEDVAYALSLKDRCVGVLWGEPMGQLEQDRAKLLAVSERAEQYLSRLLVEAEGPA